MMKFMKKMIKRYNSFKIMMPYQLWIIINSRFSDLYYIIEKQDG